MPVGYKCQLTNGETLMQQRLDIQILSVIGLYLLIGVASVATAADSWITQGMLRAWAAKQACTPDNPYCKAGVPAPAKVPDAKFDPNQVPCNSVRDACATEQTKTMTESYQKNIAGKIPPPYSPCLMSDGCASVKPWWNSQVVQRIEKKVILYDPGVRPWTEKKTCGTTFVGGVYRDNNCPK